MEEEDIRERWSEYIAELYDDERDEGFAVKKELDGPAILQDEVRNAMSRMRLGKAT